MATIQKRHETYFITVSCGYDEAAGRQIRKTCTYHPPRTGMTDKQIQKDLNAFVVEFEKKVKSSNYYEENKMRLSAFCQKYLGIAKLSPKTLSGYKPIIDNYITPSLGHMKLCEIKPINIQMFVKHLQSDNIRCDGRKGKLSNTTVKRIYSVLQSILHSACKLQLIQSNPANSNSIDLPMLEPSKTEIFTKQEATQMLDCLTNEPLMYQVLINLALLTGCRRGELLALKWTDIDFEKHTVSINKSIYKQKGEEIKIKPPKTNSSNRILSIPLYAIEMLRDYKIEQTETRLLLGDRWTNGNWIFTQWDGKPMYPTTPTSWFSKFLKRNGLKHKKFHSLRHTSATLLLSSGTNIKTVAARLGHNQLSTTNRYVHSVTEADIEAAQSLGNMFQKNNA